MLESCLSPSSPIISSSNLAPRDIPEKTFLPFSYFVLPEGNIFIDRKIPSKYDKPVVFNKNESFSSDYFVNLSVAVKQFGTYNHLGARIRLEHSKINVDNFRYFLGTDFDDLAILQFLKFGFPIGFIEDF